MSSKCISIAPMMDWTDRHDRFFLRLISSHVLLYTEMLTANALIHGDTHYLLDFNAAEQPVALQLGGNDPKKLALCAKMGEDYGYNEINLNVGCPSDRVKSGSFGACLMLNPELVGECIFAMKQVVKIPVTVKCRIGVDEHDRYEDLIYFVKTVHTAGCETFIIHARKAWLTGLSPKENREIPPLHYDRVYQLKNDFPDISVIINGGIKTISDIDEHLKQVDGVMIGREAYTNPYFLADIEKHYFSSSHQFMKSREQIIHELVPYIENQLRNNVRLSSMTRHILGLYLGQKNGRLWRRYLSENANRKNAGIHVVLEAIENLARSEHVDLA